MPDKYVVARVGDFPSGSRRIVRIGRREIGVYNINGQFFALSNICPHQLGPLCTGAVGGTLEMTESPDWKLVWCSEGEIVTCPWHGLEYHIPTGESLAFPDMRVKTYGVMVENDDVVVIE